MATEPNTINPTERRIAALKAYAVAKAAADAAKAAADAAKEVLLKVCPDEGVLEAEGYRATITVQDRREFDVDAAEDLLPEDEFDAVTVRKVDTKAWDVIARDFPANIIAKVVISKPTTVVTVKEVK